MKSILDHPIIGERYFFPRRAPIDGARWVEVDGARLACLHAHRGHDLTVLHFHGNGEVVADYLPDLVDMFDEMGANIFLAEYRGYGGSTGRPALGRMLDDVGPILEAAGPSERLVVFGRSVGSIYAIEAARRRPGLAGLILESGIADPLERILLRASPSELGVTMDELERECEARLSHRHKLAGFEGPALVLHARHDHLVEFDHAVRNHGWLGSRDKALVLFDRGDHNTIFWANREAYLREVAAFLAKVR